MWVVKGKTVAGKDVSYNVPAGKDTDKAFVMALAFQEHGKASPDDALTAETNVLWTSDNVISLDNPITITKRENYGVDKRISKGVWERHSQRAYRTIESATEALESAASEFPGDKFRIVATYTTSDVVAVSKNAMDAVGEKAPKAEEDVKGDKTVAAETGPVKPEPKPKTTPKAA